MGKLSGLDKWQIFWIFVNFYIHFGWEMSLLFYFDYLQWPQGWSPNNAFVNAFDSYVHLFHLYTHIHTHTTPKQIRKVRHEIQIGTTYRVRKQHRQGRVGSWGTGRYFRRHSVCVLVVCDLVSEMVQISGSTRGLCVTRVRNCRVLGRRVLLRIHGLVQGNGMENTTLRSVWYWILLGLYRNEFCVDSRTCTLHVQCDVESQAIDY